MAKLEETLAEVMAAWAAERHRADRLWEDLQAAYRVIADRDDECQDLRRALVRAQADRDLAQAVAEQYREALADARQTVRKMADRQVGA